MSHAVGPNLRSTFGHEEGRPLPPKTHALTARLARSWAMLFGAGVQVDGVDVQDWPPAFGPQWPATPVFPFLPQGPVDIGWWPTGAAVFGTRDDVAEQVHDKAFAIGAAHAFEPESPLRDVITVLSPAECAPSTVDALVAKWPPAFQSTWMLKPRLGTSGRGRVRGDLDGGAFAPRTANGLKRFAAAGGAILEPWLNRVDDFSAHAFVDGNGVVQFLGALRQWTTTPGVCIGLEGEWQGARALAGGAFDDTLEAAARFVGSRAAALGYAGILGVDAFSYRVDERVLLRAIVEVNARFTMGTIALGLAARAAAAGILHAGDGFSFALTTLALDGATDVFALDEVGNVDTVRSAALHGGEAPLGLTFAIRKRESTRR